MSSAAPASTSSSVTHFETLESAVGSILRGAYYDSYPFVRQLDHLALLPAKCEELNYHTNFICLNPLPARCFYHATVTPESGRYIVSVLRPHDAQCTADSTRHQRSERMSYPMPPDTAAFITALATQEVYDRRYTKQHEKLTPSAVWKLLQDRGLSFKYSTLLPDGLWKRAITKANSVLTETELLRGEAEAESPSGEGSGSEGCSTSADAGRQKSSKQRAHPRNVTSSDDNQLVEDSLTLSHLAAAQSTKSLRSKRRRA